MITLMLFVIYRACTSVQNPALLLDNATQKNLYGKAIALMVVVICVLIAGTIFVATSKTDNERSYNSQNLNNLTIYSLVGSLAILVLAFIWIAYMYRNRPEIIATDDFTFENIINVENLDQEEKDVESSMNSFDENQSTNSNS